MGKKGVFPPPSTISWLRDYFQMREEEGVNPYGFYKYLLLISEDYWRGVRRLMEELRRAVEPTERARLALAIAETKREAMRWGAVSYSSVRKLFYMLHRLHLIEFFREEPPSRGGKSRRFYRIVPEKKGYFVAGLQRILWPWTYWGGKRYKAAKRWERVPPERAWPPVS